MSKIGDGGPSLADIVRLSGIDETQIVYAFVYGSRLFGTATAESDWDIYVIVEGFVGPLRPDDKMPEGDGKYEALITHNLWDLNITAVASLYIPETHVIKPGAHHFKFTLENMKLKHEVDHYRGKHQEIFTKLFKKKRVEKAKKIMVHPIRCCQFALQILEEGRIYDYSTANEYTYHIRKSDAQTWEELEAWWFNLDEKFREITNQYKLSTPLSNLPSGLTSHYTSPTSSWQPPIHEEPSEYEYIVVPVEEQASNLFLIHYLKAKKQALSEEAFSRYDWLHRELSIKAERPFSSFPNLVRFTSGEFAPKCSLIACQAKGLILDEADDFAIVSYPFWVFSNQDNDAEQMVKLNWESVLLSEKLNGISFVLFHHDGSWRADYLEDTSVLRVGSKALEEGTLLDLFWSTWSAKGYILPSKTNTTYSFVFVPAYPLTSLTDHRIVWVGARDNKNFREDTVGDEHSNSKGVGEWDVIKPQSFYLDLMAEWVNAHAPSPFLSEGYIAYDPTTFHRFVCKSKIFQSLEIGDFVSASTKRTRILELVLIALQDNFPLEKISFYPGWELWFRFLWKKLHDFCREVEGLYEKVKDVEGDKEFSRAVASLNARQHQTFLFSIRKQSEKQSVLEMMQSYRSPARIDKMLFPTGK